MKVSRRWFDFRLEDRENKRRDEEIASFECRKAELQKIAEEIDEIQEKAKAEVKVIGFIEVYMLLYAQFGRLGRQRKDYKKT